MASLSNPLGSIFCVARERKGYTQTELGNLIGKSQGWISDVENHLVPKFDEGMRLCDLLDLNPIDVYNEMIKKLKNKG